MPTFNVGDKVRVTNIYGNSNDDPRIGSIMKVLYVEVGQDAWPYECVDANGDQWLFAESELEVIK